MGYVREWCGECDKNTLKKTYCEKHEPRYTASEAKEGIMEKIKMGIADFVYIACLWVAAIYFGFGLNEPGAMVGCFILIKLYRDKP